MNPWYIFGLITSSIFYLPIIINVAITTDSIAFKVFAVTTTMGFFCFIYDVYKEITAHKPPKHVNYF